MKVGRLVAVLAVAVALALASAFALATLASNNLIPSVVRDPLHDFVQPGVTVWWFLLGGPFRSAPSSPAGIAFASAVNAALWLALLWLLLALLQVIRRRLATRRH
ncbi:hypothetical protein PY254_15800 [Rhodanobacter sp. AS-Z3]|uniref:hypothetical protein n=1 Tax=Rhodanobacter sp. AS-Z3 TaxID=3031330 RepID=UPI002479B1D4|nr:hypothetical protein [Rhodanobacter sp. AS-Z3]WEN14676.1 hypothetical protein PY254_15800 [Rhodanobacter sp. AS-Z3]